MKIQREQYLNQLIVGRRNGLIKIVTGNPTKLSNTFKRVKGVDIHHATISRYLSFLEDAFLIEKSVRYDIKGKRYINTLCKYYFSDPGLRNALLGFRQQEESHIMENIIYNELRSRGYKVDVGMVEQRTVDKVC